MAEGVKGGERRSSNKEAASFLNSHLSRVLAAVRHASDSDTVSASACASASKSRSNGAKGRTRAAKSGGHVTARLKSCFTSEQVEDALECWSSEVKSLLDAGESENSLHLVACGSILIATEQEEIRKVIAALSTRTAATTLVIALLERVMEGSEEGPEAAQVNHLVMQATLLELLLAMRVHNQKDNCETLRALIQKQYWYHIHKSFFSLQSTSRDRGDQCTRLLSRSWALLPQLEENLVGTSKTRGVRGIEAWNEQMQLLCKEMENQLASSVQTGNVDALPMEELKCIVYKCDILWRSMCELIKCKYSFHPSLNVENVVRLMATYFSFCQQLNRRKSAIAGREEAGIQLTYALCSILQVHKVLVNCLSGSLAIWMDVFVKQLNAAAKLALSKSLMECCKTEGYLLIEEVMLTLLRFMELYKVAFVLKLKPHTLALPCIILIHLSKECGRAMNSNAGLSAGMRKCFSASVTSFRYLSAICHCTSAHWPLRQLELMVGMSLFETSQQLAAALISMIETGSRKGLEDMETLCVESCKALHQLIQSSSATYRSFREKSISLIRNLSDSAACLANLKCTCNTIIHGMQNSIRPTSTRRWNVEEEGSAPVLTFSGLPDVFQALFEDATKYAAAAQKQQQQEALPPIPKEQQQAKETFVGADSAKRPRSIEEVKKESKEASMKNNESKASPGIPERMVMPNNLVAEEGEKSKKLLKSSNGTSAPAPITAEQSVKPEAEKVAGGGVLNLDQGQRNGEYLSSDSEGEGLTLDG